MVWHFAYPDKSQLQLHCSYIHQTGVSNSWTGIWNGTMEWKMEWNNEHTQLQLTCVTGAAWSRLNYLVYLGLLPYRRSFMSNYSIAHHHASIRALAWYRCWLIIRCSVIAVLQSQTLERKIRVRLHKTIV